MMWVLWGYMCVYVPRLLGYGLHALSLRRWLHWRNQRFIRRSAWVVSVCVLVLMLWATLLTPFTYRVKHATIETNSLPADLDSYTIVHISDLHLGTYDGSHKDYLQSVFEQVNELKPDLICFTGDLVSRMTSEAEPYCQLLTNLQARDGVLSVSGNHDYDDYTDWASSEEKEADRQALRLLMQKAGWKVLCNEWVEVRKGIVVAGEENYSEKDFLNYANLQQSIAHYPDSAMLIVMQHNPKQWDHEIVGKTNATLTLSGHTHAFQTIFNLFGLELSPARLRYRRWGGLYTVGEQHLYVNTGIGMVGVPMRMGATPEITVIQLTRKKS
ncbi:MAG: metallophosphoesterase [Muribaculaceae bacterium]|nr:metallophosphoesterase [Muribaculaceae bacterium]